MSRVIEIGDIHEPFGHPDYLDFIKDTKRRFRCDTVICAGDEVDNCALSRYEQNPDGMGPGEEHVAAVVAMQKWYKAFPNLLLLESNHGMRPFKKAYSAGLPAAYLKSYSEFMEAPRGWEWHRRIIVDDVLYFHGEPFSGKDAAMNAAVKNRMSSAIGHVHAFGGVQYNHNFKDEIFGLNVGCGIDDKTYPFKYAQDNATRPTLGCGVILDGREAFFVPMR
jgi:calcineurin-like phosphoesterase family protein